MQRAIIIDGNFMMMRCYSVLDNEANGNFLTFKTPEESDRQFQLRKNTDINNFHKLLCRHLANTVQRYSYCNTVVMAKDGKSWRKDVPILQPTKYVPTGVEMEKDVEDDADYKANRVKDERTDWDLVYKLFGDFCLAMEKSFNMAYLLTKGAEGDDWMWFSSRWLYKEMKLHSLIYASDGDITQTINDHVVVARQVRTKLGENGELCTSPKVAEFYNKTSSVSIFDINHAEMSHITEMFKEVKIGGVHHIESNPAASLIIKVLCGDKKDNIMSIVQYSKSGKSWKRPNETFLTQFLIDERLTMAATPQQYEIVHPIIKPPKPVKVPKPKKLKKGEIPDLVETVVIPEPVVEIVQKPNEIVTLQPLTMKHLYDEEFIRKYLTVAYAPKLKECTGKDMNIDHAMKVYKNNLKLLHLSKEQIPNEVFENMQKVIESKKEMINKCSLKDMEHAGKLINAISGVSVNSFFDQFELDKEENKIETPDACVVTDDALAFLGL